MILYTTMPQELVFPTDESDFGKQTVIQYQGIPLLVEMDENHDYRVVQIMSTDPSHYLNEECCPGAILSKRVQ